MEFAPLAGLFDVFGVIVGFLLRVARLDVEGPASALMVSGSFRAQGMGDMAEFSRMRHMSDGVADTYVRAHWDVDPYGEDVLTPVPLEEPTAYGDDDVMWEPVLDADGYPVAEITDEVAYYETVSVEGGVQMVHTTRAFAALFDARDEALQGIGKGLEDLHGTFVSTRTDPQTGETSRMLAAISRDDYAAMSPAQRKAARSVSVALDALTRLEERYPALLDIPVRLSYSVPRLSSGQPMLLTDGGGLMDRPTTGLVDLYSRVARALDVAVGGPDPKENPSVFLEPGSPRYILERHRQDVEHLKRSAGGDSPQLQDILMTLEHSRPELLSTKIRSELSEPLPEGYESWTEFEEETIRTPYALLHEMGNAIGVAYVALGADPSEARTFWSIGRYPDYGKDEVGRVFLDAVDAMDGVVSAIDTSRYEAAAELYTRSVADCERLEETISKRARKVMAERAADPAWVAVDGPSGDRTLDAPGVGLEDVFEDHPTF